MRDATQNRPFVFDPPDPKPVIDFIWFHETSRSTTVRSYKANVEE